MQFLGTLSAAPDFKTADAPDAEADKSHSLQVRLLFGRVDVVRIPRKPLPQEDQEGNLEEQLSFYSLDRETARTVLGEIASPGAVFAALQPHLDRHEAKLERLLVLKTQSGQRGMTEETDEIRYDAGEAEGIATRNTGLVLEIEPVRAANASIVDIDMVPQMVKLNGDLHFDGIAEKYQSQPVFETRKVTTSLSAALGEQAFIGTFSQPTDTGVNGQKDTGRVWLGFIRVNLVKP